MPIGSIQKTTSMKLQNKTSIAMNAQMSAISIYKLQAFPVIAWGGLIAGVLDATDGVVAYGLHGLNPIQVLQYIASGALGAAAFTGGLLTAGAGAIFHFFIAFVVAAVFYLGSRAVPQLAKHFVASGLIYGAAVYFVMNYLVLPFSAVAP